MRKATKWTDEYRGVAYQVSLHGEGDDLRPEGTWCYYLFINEDQIPDGHIDKFDLPPKTNDKGQVTYPYMASWLADLDWHCGITWYSKEGGVDGAKRVFKAGCDYAHYWDQGKSYNLDFVAIDARATIDDLLSRLSLLIRCSWDGCFDKAENMTQWGNGYINNACIEARNNAFPDAEPITAQTNAR